MHSGSHTITFESSISEKGELQAIHQQVMKDGNGSPCDAFIAYIHPMPCFEDLWHLSRVCSSHNHSELCIAVGLCVLS